MMRNFGTRQGRLLGILGCLVATGGATLLSGCTESETADALAGPTTQSAVEAMVGEAAISLDSLPAELDLDEDQRAALATAIDDLNTAREEMRSRVESERPRGPRRGADGARGQGEGADGDRGPRGRRGPHSLSSDFVPPMMAFIGTASEILDRDQFVVLAQYLAENRPERGGREGGRKGRAAQLGERIGRRLAQELGLSEDQIESVRTIVSESREQFRDLRESVRDEEMTAMEALTEAVTLASSTRTELAAVLTSEQLETYAALKATRIQESIERRLENLDERMTQRATLISQALDMDDAQASETRAILLGTVSERTDVLRGVEDGSIDPEVAGFRTLVIEKNAWDAVYGLLTAEQQEAWNALRDLLPIPRGRI